MIYCEPFKPPHHSDTEDDTVGKCDAQAQKAFCFYKHRRVSGHGEDGSSCTNISTQRAQDAEEEIGPHF